jgi:hypothetical protein
MIFPWCTITQPTKGLGRTCPFPLSASSNARCIKSLGFMVPNLGQIFSFPAITGSPCPFVKEIQNILTIRFFTTDQRKIG